MFNLRKLANLLFKVVLIAAVLFAAFLFQNYRKNAVDEVAKETEAPVRNLEISAPQEFDYQWKYKGRDYAVSLTLYDSVYNYYQNSPKEYEYYGELPENWAEEYYGIFLNTAEGDESIKKLAAELRMAGEKNGLNNDQIVELALSFVQSISYDEAKAIKILSGSDVEKPRYPYEVLYDRQGVCSGKSFLAYNLVKEMGYGVALLEYESERHIALGIKCPMEYSNYDSGYCFAETTAEGNKIGLIPEFSAETNRAQSLETMELFQDASARIKTLGNPKIFQSSEGNIYNGIKTTVGVKKEIEKLRGEISVLRKELSGVRTNIDALEKNVESMKKKMEKLQDQEKYREYNEMVSEYNQLVKKYQKKVEEYNSLVAQYNKKVGRYNGLIRSF